MDVTVRKAENLLWACTRACGATWVLSPKVVLRLYVSIIRRFIILASLVWLPSCQTANTKKRISMIHRLACLGITGAMRDSPIGAMEALTGFSALELVIQCEAKSAAHRFWSLGFCSYLHRNRGHSSILMRLERSDYLIWGSML